MARQSHRPKFRSIRDADAERHLGEVRAGGAAAFPHGGVED